MASFSLNDLYIAVAGPKSSVSVLSVKDLSVLFSYRINSSDILSVKFLPNST